MSKASNVRRRLCAAQYSVFATLALGACSDDDVINTPAPEDDTVAIRYTEYGIPHIRTNDYANVGFGQGYAQARDNLCEIERSMLAFDGQLSRHFGPAGEGSPMASAPSNLGSDIYFRNLNESGLIEDLIAKPAPLGPRDEVREMVRGFAEGFNQYVRRARRSAHRREWRHGRRRRREHPGLRFQSDRLHGTFLRLGIHACRFAGWQRLPRRRVAAHVLAVDRSDISALQRPDRALLAEKVGRRPLLARQTSWLLRPSK